MWHLRSEGRARSPPRGRAYQRTFPAGGKRLAKPEKESARFVRLERGALALARAAVERHWLAETQSSWQFERKRLVFKQQEYGTSQRQSAS